MHVSLLLKLLYQLCIITKFHLWNCSILERVCIFFLVNTHFYFIVSFNYCLHFFMVGPLSNTLIYMCLTAYTENH